MAITALNVAVATPDSSGSDALRGDTSTNAGQLFADLFANLSALPLTQTTPDQLLAEGLAKQQTLSSAETLLQEDPLVENMLIQLGLLPKVATTASAAGSLPITERETGHAKSEEDLPLTAESIQADPSMLAALLQPIPNTITKVEISPSLQSSEQKPQLNLTSDKALPGMNEKLLAAEALAARTLPADSNEVQAEFKISDSTVLNNLTTLSGSMGLGNTVNTPPSQPTANTLGNTISAPVNDQTVWSKQVGERIILMNNAGQQTAELHLNPSNLGPMQVTLSFNSDQTTSAMFVAHHPETRQALQDALPQLREMFSAAGISLGQTNVSAQSQQQNPQNRDQAYPNAPRNTGDTAILKDDADQLVAARVIPLNRSSGTVDLFA